MAVPGVHRQALQHEGHLTPCPTNGCSPNNCYLLLKRHIPARESKSDNTKYQFSQPCRSMNVYRLNSSCACPISQRQSKGQGNRHLKQLPSSNLALTTMGSLGFFPFLNSFSWCFWSKWFMFTIFQHKVAKNTILLQPVSGTSMPQGQSTLLTLSSLI